MPKGRSCRTCVQRTADGGRNWVASTLPQGIRFYTTAGALAVVPGSPAHAWAAVGQSGAVLKTEDAGLTWQLKQLEGVSNSIDFVAAPDAKTVFAIQASYPSK